MKLRIPFRYELVKVLGRGGMGVVVLANDRKLGRSVAVKVIRTELGPSEGALARFVREARVMSEIEHPHLIRLLDVDFEHAPPFMVMELIDGGTLEQRLAKGGTWTRAGRMEPRQLVRLGVEVGGALAALHARDLLHRDLKPANIMLRAKTGGAVLMDLGLVKQLGGTVLTATGAMVGTPRFLPPEVLLDRPWSPAADQFQLAAVLRLAMTGQSHVNAGSLEELIFAIREGEWEPFPEILPRPPEGLQEALERGLHPEPTERFDSIEDFVAALDALELSPEERASASVAAASVAAPAHRTLTEWLPGLGAGLLGVLLGSATLSGAGSPPAAAESPAPDTPALEKSVRLDGRGGLRVDVRRPCVSWWADRPTTRRLLLSGANRLAVPDTPAPWVLRWQAPGEAASRRLEWRALADTTADHLLRLTGSEDPTAEIAAWRSDGSAGPLESERRAWRPLVEWIPHLFEGELEEDKRRRLWHAWQRVQRSAAQVRFRGGEPTELAPPVGRPGSLFVGKPDWPAETVRPEMEAIGGSAGGKTGVGVLLVPDWRGAQNVLPTGIRFRWPATPRRQGTVALVMRLKVFSEAFQLRVRTEQSSASPDLFLWGRKPPGKRKNTWFTLCLPARFAPPDGTPMVIEQLRFAGEYNPQVRVRYFDVWWTR